MAAKNCTSGSELAATALQKEASIVLKKIEIELKQARAAPCPDLEKIERLKIRLDVTASVYAAEIAKLRRAARQREVTR